MVFLRRGTLLLLIVSIFFFTAHAFQSDELQDDDEWGIVGGAPSSSKNSDNDHLEQVTARSVRKPSQAPAADGSHSSSSDSRVTFQLEHSFGDSAAFHLAGAFTARLRNLPNGGQTLTKLRLTRNALTAEEEEAFKALVEEDGFYQIRVPANVLSPNKDMVLSSVKARCLAATNLQERFEFYMEKGNVIGAAYGAIDCSYPRYVKYPTKWTFDTHIVTKVGEQASRNVVVNKEIEVELGDDGQPKKPLEKTFWQKYWMYIVPLVFIALNVMTQAANLSDDTASQGGTSQRAVSAGPRRR